MPRTYHVFRHLAAVDTPHGRTRDSVGPVLTDSGQPVAFDDLRAAVTAADRMNAANRRVGAGRCVNLSFTAGWSGAES